MGGATGQRLANSLNKAKIGADLSADVLKYRDTLGSLRATQTRLGTSGGYLKASIAAVEQQYDTAKTAARDYGINVANVAKEHRNLTTAVGLSQGRIARAQGRELNRGRRNQIQSEVIAVAAPALLLAAPLLKSAIEFESKLADINKVVDFKTPDGLLKMGDAILDLSTKERIPMVVSGLADITAAAGQAGIARKELVQFTRDAAKIGVAFDLSGQEAGGAMTGLRSIFGLNQKGAVLVADSYNHLSNNMDATASGILRVANRAGSLGKIVGLSGQQVGALAATFLALKTPPEVAATGINALLTNLATADKQPERFQQALRGIGYEASDLKERMKEDAQGTLLEFLGTIEDSEDKIGILADLFGKEYADDMAKLVGSLDTYRKALGLVAKETNFAGSAQKEYEDRAKTTKNDLIILRNQVERLGITTGGLLLPSLKTAASFLGRVADGATDIAERFPLTTKVVGLLAISLVGLKVATLGAGFAGTLFSDAWIMGKGAMDRVAPRLVSRTAELIKLRTAALSSAGGLNILSMKAIPGIGVAMKALSVASLFNPIGLAVAGIAAGAFLIIKFWKPIKSFMSGVWLGIQEVIGPMGPTINAIVESLKTAASWWLKLVSPVDSAASSLEGAKANGQAVGQMIGFLVKAVGTLFKPFELINGLVRKFADGLGAGKGIFGSIKGLFTSDEPPVIKPSTPVKTAAPLKVAASAKPAAPVVTSGKVPAAGHPPVVKGPTAPVAGIAPKPMAIGRPPQVGKTTAAQPAAGSPSVPPLDKSRVTLSPTVVTGSGSAGQTINVDMSGMVINANTAADAQAIADNLEAQIRKVMAETARKANAARRGALHDGANASTY